MAFLAIRLANLLGEKDFLLDSSKFVDFLLEFRFLKSRDNFINNF